MYEWTIFCVFTAVLEWAESNVSFGEHISFESMSDKYPHSDIEFMILYE